MQGQDKGRWELERRFGGVPTQRDQVPEKKKVRVYV